MDYKVLITTILTSALTSGIIGFSIKQKIKHSYDRELDELRSRLKMKNSNIQSLSKEQRVILQVIPKFISNYYSNVDLEKAPQSMKQKTVYSNMEGGIVAQKLVHALFEADQQIAEKIMKAQNPIIGFNVLMFEVASSKETVKLLTFQMNKTYTNKINDLGFENSTLYVWSLLYKCLIKDFKYIDIPDESLLKYNMNDFDTKVDVKNFKKLRKQANI